MGPKNPGCVSCQDIVRDWYKQVDNYDFTTGLPISEDLKINQFAQVINSYSTGGRWIRW